MAILAPLVPKITKLIPRLVINHDGEVVATMDAIKWILQSAGFDFHTLALPLEAEDPKIVVVYRDELKSAREPHSWRDVARRCQDNDRTLLNHKERKFVCDMAARTVRSGEPTEMQATWLRAIYATRRKAANA